MRIISFATEDSEWKSPRMGIILNVDGRDSGDRLDCEKLFEPADRPSNPLAWFDTSEKWFQTSRDTALRLGGDANARAEARKKGWLVPSEDAYWFAPVPRPGQDRVCRTELSRPRRGEWSRRSRNAGDLLEVLELCHRARRAGRHSADERESRLRGRACGRHRTARETRERPTAPTTTCSDTPRSTTSPRAISSSATGSGSAENRATRSRRWARRSSRRTRFPIRTRLRITLTVNGNTMQDSNTSQLIFRIPQLIEFITQSISLEPGDVIATGTPAGVGFARKPPVFLKPGDVMDVDIEKIGDSAILSWRRSTR